MAQSEAWSVFSRDKHWKTCEKLNRSDRVVKRKNNVPEGRRDIFRF